MRDQALYVQYGCGLNAPQGWENFDASLTLKWERTPVLGQMYSKNPDRFPPNVRFGNIVKGLPIAERICKGVYASHVLEHLTLHEFHMAIKNTERILRPTGIFRLVVPDLEWAAKEYIRRLDQGDPTSNSIFLAETRLGVEVRRRGLGFLYEALNRSRHFWMWDAPALSHALWQHGFKKVRRCNFGDCEDPMFALVEDKGRFEHAVAMEAIA